MLRKDNNRNRREDGPKPIGEFIYQTPAIETLYRGLHFRSRLEARWAAFFDQMGWDWNYEPIDLPGWIPDFHVGKQSLLVEVKPFTTLGEFGEEVEKIAGAIKGTAYRDILLAGLSPQMIWISDYFDSEDKLESMTFDEALIGPASIGNVLCASTLCYRDRITGIYDGDRYYPDELEGAELAWGGWAKACNLTQWRKHDDA